MKNKRMLAMLVVTLTCAMGLSACSLGGNEEKPDQVVVENTAEPTKEPEKEEAPSPTVTPTPAPNMQVTTYKSKDMAIAVTLPDAVWANKMDTEKVYSFASANAGSVLIEHGVGEEDMASRMIPNTTDLAVAMEQAGGLTDGTDFEVRNYAITEEETHHVLNYAVVMLKEERDYAFKLVRVLYNDNEYYALTGIVNEEDSQQLAEVTYVMDHFQILREDSTIKIPEFVEPVTEPETTEEKTESTETTENTETSTPAPAANGGIAPYRDNPDNTDNSKTRTIYRNSNGKPLVISINANGEWVDADGNKYRFTNECDVYDQNDVDYYYHGEAADVYYMPVN